MPVRRYDAGTMTRMEKTPEGFIKGTARVTRTGVFTYRNADGTLRRELRHPDEVFSKTSLESMKMIPITNLHPADKLVNADSAKSLAIGFTGENVSPDGKFIVIPIAITSADGVKAVENGREELSLGYEVELDETPGSYDGQEYDCVQRNIRYNHLAIVDRGRAGADVRLNMDEGDAMEVHEDMNQNHDPKNGRFTNGSGGGQKGVMTKAQKEEQLRIFAEKSAGLPAHIVKAGVEAIQSIPTIDNDDEDNSNLNTRSDNMPKLRLDNGLEYDAAPEVILAFDAAQKLVQSTQAKLDEAIKETEKLRADADTAKETAKQLQTKVDGIPSAIAEGVKARMALEKVANDSLDEEMLKKLDSMTDEDIRKAVIISRFPEAKLDGMSADYIQARFDSAVEIKVDADDLIAKQREKALGKRADSTDGCDPEKKRKAMIDGMKDAYKQGNVNS